MKQNQNLQNALVVLLLILSAAIVRIFIQIPNFTPIAAIALFGATYIQRKTLAVILPLIILFISDLMIGLYSPILMAGVYGAFILIAMIGFVLRKKLTPINVFVGSLASSVVFFLVTNFVVWIEGLWYPMTPEGLLECYVMALPFFKFEVAGTLFFNLVFFGTYFIVTRRILTFSKA